MSKEWPRLVGTPKDGPNPLEIALQNDSVISHEESHARDRIRGIKGLPIIELPVSYPIVDEQGNFLCMSDDLPNLPPDELLIVGGELPPDDEAQEYEYGDD